MSDKESQSPTGGYRKLAWSICNALLYLRDQATQPGLRKLNEKLTEAAHVASEIATQGATADEDDDVQEK